MKGSLAEGIFADLTLEIVGEDFCHILKFDNLFTPKFFEFLYIEA